MNATPFIFGFSTYNLLELSSNRRLPICRVLATQHFPGQAALVFVMCEEHLAANDRVFDSLRPLDQPWSLAGRSLRHSGPSASWVCLFAPPLR
jgi:hypothetical protein